MKKLFLILILLFSLSVNSQVKEQNNDQPTIIQIDDNLYSFKSTSDNLKHVGFYKKINGKFVRHGKWKLISSRKKLMEGTFVDGEMQSLTIYEDGGKKTINKHDFEIIRLKRQIYRLEDKLSYTDD